MFAPAFILSTFPWIIYIFLYGVSFGLYIYIACGICMSIFIALCDKNEYNMCHNYGQMIIIFLFWVTLWPAYIMIIIYEFLTKERR